MSNHRWEYGIMAALVLSGSMAAAPAQTFPLLDGPRQAVIVGDGRVLRDMIQRCTGVQLEMIGENRFNPGTHRLPIFVGETSRAQELLGDRIAKLDDEGYLFDVRPEMVILFARPGQGQTVRPIQYAQAQFVRQFLGADQYFPGPLGEVYPQHDRVLIPVGLTVEEPAYKSRHWSGYCGAAGPAWRVRASGGMGRYQFHHAFYRILPVAKYADHPEYYPIRWDKRKNDWRDSQQRYVPTRTPGAYWQPCTSNPQVLEIVVDAAIRELEANPWQQTFSLGINDAGGFCNCPECLAQTPAGIDPHSDVANAHRMYAFYDKVARRVAQRFPKARLGYLIYDDLNDWTPDKLPPNLMPYRTLSFADCWDPAYKQRLDAELKDLSSRASHFGIYCYYHGGAFLIPRIYLHQMGEALRYCRDLGVDGFYAEAYPNWGLDGPKLWVTEKLLWNPDQDVDALLDRWCGALFGKAAPAMRRYFDFLETTWANQKPSNDRRGMYRLLGSRYKPEQFTEIFPLEVCDRGVALLDAARPAADSDLARQRVDFYRVSFGATRLACARYYEAVKLNRMRDADLAAIRDKRPTTTVPQWLAALQPIAALPRVDDYMDQLRTSVPQAFQAFCEDTERNRRNPPAPVKTSFEEWDTNVEAMWHVGAMVSDAALASGPASAAAYRAAVHEQMIAAAKKAGGAVADAADMVEGLTAGMAVDATTAPQAPVLDGKVTAAEWGDPAFDGRFYEYPFEDRATTDRTRFWVRVADGMLFVAFECFQPGATVRTQLTARDQVALRDDGKGNRVVDLGQYLPYLRDVDSIGVGLPNHNVVIVTAGGGLFDSQATSWGHRPDWDAATAAVSRSEQGWYAEIAVPLDQAVTTDAATKSTWDMNFFRCGGAGRYAVRSAWVAAYPNRWSIHPNRDGLVFHATAAVR